MAITNPRQEGVTCRPDRSRRWTGPPVPPSARIATGLAAVLALAACGQIRVVPPAGLPCVPPVLHGSPGTPTLAAGWLPAGFSLTSPPASAPTARTAMLSASGASGATFSVQAFAASPDPAGGLLRLARVTATVTVNGQPAILGEDMNLPPGLTGPGALVLSWSDASGSSVLLQSTGLAEGDVLQLAAGIRFTSGFYGESGCTRTPAVAGALSRHRVLGLVQGAEQAKLVRLVDLAAEAPDLTQCQLGCDPAVVVWVVESPESGPGDMAPPPPGSSPPAASSGPFWQLLELDAGTGASKAADDSDGPLPACWWSTIPDYAG
jgi:hypothetical protein